MAAPQLTWHMGSDNDRRTELVELVNHAQTSVFYAIGQDPTEAGRWALVRFDVYPNDQTHPVRLGEAGTLADCRQHAEDDLIKFQT